MFKLALSTLAALPLVSASSHFIMGGTSPIVVERVDSIVNPGTISSHSHVIAGASNIDHNSNYDSLRNARCTTVPFQDVDKSAYWAPSVFHQDQNDHSVTHMTPYFNIYYFFDRNGPGEKVHAFPKGLKMLAGSPTRTTYDATNKADQAVSFVCLNYNGGANGADYAERHDIFFPDPNVCKDGIRMQIFFPQCWDGVNLDSADHKSHMAYPADNYNGGKCPSTHPVHLVGLFYEMVIPAGKFNYWGKGAYVLANGDQTGLGFHADFINGWDVDVLQNAVDNCHNMNGAIEACSVLAPYINKDKANACTLESNVVDEDVGLGHSIPALPGCNTIRDDTSKAATCPGQTTPGFKNAVTPLPGGWKDIGCIQEGGSGRALTEASTSSDTMTKASCASFCASKGLAYAATEFGRECYCGNSLKNGASQNTVGWEQCNVRCSGNSLYENCGGPQKLELLYSPTPGQTPVSAPVPSSSTVVASPAPVTSSTVIASPSPVTSSTVVAAPVTTPVTPVTSVVQTSSSAAAPAPTGSAGTWALAECVSDATSRTLTGYSFAAPNMTVKSCTATCDSKGFSIAGIEYGEECYCGNSYSNGAVQKLDAGRACYMTCNGSGERNCGGTWALSIYKKSTISKRAKHFGRMHNLHPANIF